jgi:hypothetical protein
MEKFTKGPWEIFGDWAINDSNGRLIAQFEPLCDDISLANTDESFANAHLIAAAPEMYALLKNIQLEHCNTAKLYNEIDDLLAKARGEL